MSYDNSGILFENGYKNAPKNTLITQAKPPSKEKNTSLPVGGNIKRENRDF